MKTFKALLWITALVSFGCSGNNENAHTTATTFVSPPPRQTLKIETVPSKKLPAKPDDPKKRVDPNQPLMTFNFSKEKGIFFLGDSPVGIDFSLANAQLKDDGGQFRVRYTGACQRRPVHHESEPALGALQQVAGTPR